MPACSIWANEFFAILAHTMMQQFNTSEKPVAIIGAGPAGMTAAYILAKQGIPVTLYEASESVGGLAKSFTLWGQIVDVGPHRFFSTDTRVNQLWLEVVGNDYSMVDRLTRILYKSKFYRYPLQPLNALSNLGIGTSVLCMLSYFRQKLLPSSDDGSFESWVVNRFGRKLYEIFFKTYSEKLWGITCRQLDADFAAQRIKKLSLWEAAKNAIFGGRTSHKTLVDQFAYPHGGTGMVYTRMADRFRLHGGDLRLGTPIRRVLVKDGVACGVETEHGVTHVHSHVISTMPLSLMAQTLPEAPESVSQAARSLNYRNTIIVYLRIGSPEIFPDNWLYVHSPDLASGRITNFRNWVPHILGESRETIVALEFWCYDEDGMWLDDDESLIKQAIKDLHHTKLAAGAPVLNGHVLRIKRCYPVYARGYREHLDVIRRYLDTVQNLHVIGRYGAFKYNNQDHSILMGILAAENICKGTSNDLWSINTDYDDYQERSLITATGLASQE
jgi:protoporphyrinogen oxidase